MEEYDRRREDIYAFDQRQKIKEIKRKNEQVGKKRNQRNNIMNK